jgi:hypothetical protein
VQPGNSNTDLYKMKMSKKVLKCSNIYLYTVLSVTHCSNEGETFKYNCW